MTTLWRQIFKLFLLLLSWIGIKNSALGKVCYRWTFQKSACTPVETCQLCYWDDGSGLLLPSPNPPFFFFLKVIVSLWWAVRQSPAVEAIQLWSRGASDCIDWLWGTISFAFQSVSVSPPNDAISIDFRPLKLQPDSSRQYTVAHITFRGKGYGAVSRNHGTKHVLR